MTDLVNADVTTLPAKLEALLDSFAAQGDPRLTAKAEELVATVVELYGEGLRRIVAALETEPELLSRLASDDLVGNLMMLHGLHPEDVAARVQAALDKVRPYLGSHAGGIEFLGVDDAGVAHLALQGSCDGCAGSAATVHDAVERAVLAAAPDVVAVQVDGVVEPEPRHSGLLQIGMRCPDGLVEAVSA